jgi:hypothetical protein
MDALCSSGSRDMKCIQNLGWETSEGRHYKRGERWKGGGGEEEMSKKDYFRKESVMAFCFIGTASLDSDASE